MNTKENFTTSNNKTFRMAYTNPYMLDFMSESIISWIPIVPRDYVVVCIGTDRSTGDALGPLTGSFLSDFSPKKVTIYGSIHNPVHAQNLQEYINEIHEIHHNPYIVAVDACLGRSSSVGELIIGEGPLKPGAALKKSLPSIGNIHITGVVNVSGFMEYAILQNTRLSIVIDLAMCIAEILRRVDQYLTYKGTMYSPLSNLRESKI